MSGLVRKKEQDTVFLTVKHHTLCEEAKSQRDDFEAIETKNPRTNQMVTKFIRRYESVEGFVNKIEWYDTQKQYETRYLGYKLHIDALGQPVVLDLPFKSRIYDVFSRFAENIDWSKPVKFSAWHDRKGDSTAFCARQGDAVVKWKFTKDNPQGCPEPTFDETDGWDFKAVRRWLKQRLDTVVIPAVTKAGEARAKTAEMTKREQADSAQAPRAQAAAANARSQYEEPEYPPMDMSEPDDDRIPF